MEKRTVAKRYGSIQMPIYYFVINGTDVRVTPSIRREYEKGDVYEYVQYTRGDKTIGDGREYSLLWGIVALVIEIIVNYVLLSLFWFYIDSEGKLKKKRVREHSVPIDYSKLSKKELYKLCRNRGLRLIESKCKSRKYLEECLRNDESIDKYSVEQKTQSELWERIVIQIGTILNILVCVSVSVFFYYLIYLHT